MVFVVHLAKIVDVVHSKNHIYPLHVLDYYEGNQQDPDLTGRDGGYAIPILYPILILPGSVCLIALFIFAWWRYLRRNDNRQRNNLDVEAERGTETPGSPTLGLNRDVRHLDSCLLAEEHNDGHVPPPEIASLSIPRDHSLLRTEEQKERQTSPPELARLPTLLTEEDKNRQMPSVEVATGLSLLDTEEQKERQRCPLGCVIRNPSVLTKEQNHREEPPVEFARYPTCSVLTKEQRHGQVPRFARDTRSHVLTEEQEGYRRQTSIPPEKLTNWKLPCSRDTGSVIKEQKYIQMARLTFPSEAINWRIHTNNCGPMAAGAGLSTEAMDPEPGRGDILNSMYRIV